jgi:hypothetical protein
MSPLRRNCILNLIILISGFDLGQHTKYIDRQRKQKNIKVIKEMKNRWRGKGDGYNKKKKKSK